MNLLTATVKLGAEPAILESALGAEYWTRLATIPQSQVQIKLFCHPGNTERAERLKNQSSAFVSGMVLFTADLSKPLGLVVDQLEIEPSFSVNQAVLGNAYFLKKEPQTKANGSVSVRIGTTLDNGTDSLYLYMEADQSRAEKVLDRYKAGRALTVVGQLREYRGGQRSQDDQPYRAISCMNFSTRAERGVSSSSGGRPSLDPLPDTSAY